METLSGVVVPRWAGEGRVTVDMGPPVLAPAKVPTTLRAGSDGEAPALDVPLEVEGASLRVSAVSMGNPHAVTYVEDVDAAPVGELGPRVEHHPAFPNRVNVEFVEVVDRGRVRQRTWERGTGETLACGSGACATAVASMLLGHVDEAVTVELRGGELEISWAGAGATGGSGAAESAAASVWMTGPTATVFTGEIPLEEG